VGRGCDEVEWAQRLVVTSQARLPV
jgi:hypothetical protein